jgi:hypothetical protein
MTQSQEDTRIALSILTLSKCPVRADEALVNKPPLTQSGSGLDEYYTRTGNESTEIVAWGLVSGGKIVAAKAG